MKRLISATVTALIIIWAAALTTPSKAFDVSTYFDLDCTPNIGVGIHLV